MRSCCAPRRKKRRDEAGAPFELHPATRRLLQGEVARQFGKPQREGRSLWLLFAQLWPRLAWGIAILAVLGIVVWVALPGTRVERSEELLAKNEPVRQAAPAKGALPPAPTTRAVVPAPATEAPRPKPTAVAYADRSQNQPSSAVAQPAAGPKQPAKDNLREPVAKEAADKLLPAPAEKLADRKKNTEGELAAAGGTVAQAPAGGVGGAVGQRYGLAGGSAPPGNAPAAPAVPPPVDVTAMPASVVAADEASKLKDSDAGRQSLAYRSLTEAASANRASAAPATAVALASSYAGSSKAEKSLGIPQRFAQVTTGQKAKAALSGKATPAHPVLASFQVEQSGSELRIVDGDGSVYSGYVRLLDTTRRVRAIGLDAPAATEAARSPKDADEAKPAARLDADLLLPQTYFFRVTGTNRSLHQKVVFTGSLLPAAGANKAGLAGTNLGVVNNLEGLPSSSAQPPSVPLVNTRISGKVVVGNAKAVEINAEPMKK